MKDRHPSGISTPARRIIAAIFGVLIISAACLAQTSPSGLTVADVIPLGLYHVPPQKVMSFIKTRPGTEYQEDVVKEDVRQLYDSHSFANIVVELKTLPDKKVIVYFKFQEFPSLVQEIIFNGAKHLKKDDLESLTGLRKGVPLNPVSNQLACQAIVRRYKEKGRMWASVELVEGAKREDTRVVFNITEGPVAKVTGIDFIGNHFVSGPVLRTHVDSSRAFLGMLGGDFDELKVEHDVKKLEEYYRNFGFFDVRVDRSLEWAEDQRTVKVVFHISEGTRYKVAGVDVVRNISMDRKQLLDLVTLHPDEYYNKQKAEVTKDHFQKAYGYRGLNPTIIERVTYREQQPGQVDVHYEFEERPVPSRVGQIYIVNNTVTRDTVIRRQLELYPGQILEYPNLKLAEVNLARLNIFELNAEQGIRPTVTVLNPDDPNEYKDILVSVQETRTGSLLFGVGVNSDAGLQGSIVLNERNFDITRWPTSLDDLFSGHAFRGGGQEFQIQAVPGTQYQRYQVSWREPRLFDSLYSLSVGGYFFDRIYNEDVEQRLGTRIGVGRQINRNWAVSTGLRVENVGIHNVPFYAPVDYQSVVGNNFLVGLSAGVTYDTRDSYLRPTEGTQINARFEEVLGDFTFPVFNIDANQYFTIAQRNDGSGRHVLALRSQAGWAGTHTPVFERFYVGGFSSMRGFEFRGVGPEINGFKVGGDFMWLNSLEYQVPIKANDNLWLVAFLDTGTDESRFEIKNYRAAVGLGLRVMIPMMGPVPIALDFGYPISMAPGDSKQLFSFWVGFFGH
jgi:outer membrane protein assembly complex protein YaeT